MSEDDKTGTEATPTNAAGGGTQPEPGAGKTFSQDELDAILADRLRRERAKYEDYDALKDKAAKYDKAEEAQKTELEKAQEKAQALERAAQEQQSTYQQKLIRMEVRMQAATMGFKNPDDAYLLADLDGVSLDDEGNILGAKAALDALAKAKPYLLGDPPKPPAPNTQGGEGNPPESGREVLTPGEQRAAELAQHAGYNVDMNRVRELKRRSAVVRHRAPEQQE